MERRRGRQIYTWLQGFAEWDASDTGAVLLLLSRFSRVWLCATPETAAHQAPPSIGFSRQEHWSGLPFLSPMHESEKWKWSRSVMSDSVTPWTAAYQAPPSMGFSRQECWSGVPSPSLNPLHYSSTNKQNPTKKSLENWKINWKSLMAVIFIYIKPAIST